MAIFQFAIPPDPAYPFYSALEIDFPSGTRYYGDIVGAPASPSVAAYKPQIESLGSISYALMDDDRNMAHEDMQGTILDPDNSLSNMLGTGALWQYSAVRSYLVPQNATSKSQWTQSYGGVLGDLKPAGRCRFNVTIERRFRELESPVTLITVGPIDWPNADKTALGQKAPMIWGKHEDYGDQSTGACPTLYVDTVGFRYLVALGRVNVLRVYAAGVVKAGSTYAITYTTVGGRTYTLIDFTSNQSTSNITCDVEGYDTAGDLSGSMVFEATDVLKHALANVVFAKTNGGNWVSGIGSAPINTASFTTVQGQLAGRANGAAYCVSMYIANETTGSAIISAICKATGMHVMWDQAGNIAAYYDSTYSLDAGYANPVIRFPSDIGEPNLGTESAGSIATVVVQYAKWSSEPSVTAAQGIHAKIKKHRPNPVDKEGNTYYQQQVTDDRATVKGSISINAEYSPATTP